MAGLASAMSEDEVRLTRAAYYGLSARSTTMLGVIGYLKASGQYDNTLIVFTCDHGEQLGDHHLLGKLGYFDESFRIPLIIRDPSPEADTSRGRIVEQFTETIDVMPTILAWLGQRAAYLRRGVAASIPARRTPGDWRTEVHYEYDFRTFYDDVHDTVLDFPADQCRWQ